MNIKFLVLVFIGIFFSCLGLSKLANFYFDISSDYLTATATFFAAFVALYLYSDWREQHKVSVLNDKQKVLSNIGVELNKLFVEILDRSYEGNQEKEFFNHKIRELVLLLTNIEIYLETYEVHVSSYNN